MPLMDTFRDLYFSDQINLLIRIQDEKLNETIPALFDLYKKPLPDTMVDHMVVKSLQLLLAANETETISRIKNGDMSEKEMCINIAGINRFSSAAPVLHDLLKNEKYKGLTADIFFALGEIRAPESMKLFHEYIKHPNDMLASLSIQMVGRYKDENSIDTLFSFIQNAETAEQYETCSLQLSSAVEALATMKTQKSLSYLASRIHHRNSTIRRLISDEMVKAGAAAIPFIAEVFDRDNADSKILAANILGLIGLKPGGDVMVRALDQGKADDANVRYAIYEAFGKIHFLKGITCLMDALESSDDLILIAVVTALESQFNPGVISRIKELIGTSGAHSEKLIRAIVAAKAINIFKGLYDDEKTSQAIMAEIMRSKDPEVISAFQDALSNISGSKAQIDLQKLSKSFDAQTDRKDVLAVDDSKAMLNFYRMIAGDLNLNIITAGNGKEALSFIEFGQHFDLIITDMNMPVMDGLELTSLIRKKTGLSKIPIIMVTTESEQAQKDMAKLVGVNDFITKPFTAEVLKEKVNSFLKAK